ncbi:hypothetical protein K8352_19050 [Flavobacteriaceae bacterium F89]|uniref:Rieske domain-containing protein n=1 Tax=Cerina litoralis TaxID=2874477 RepID=A0AAE3JRG4_9FLAO|nr:hypothetical protein [Cerina litoralis]MCG2462869.1 hypothetical protein [Cerina litoralis]
MWYKVTFFLAILLTSACSKESTNRNPYLLDAGFRFDMNLNLPKYNPLRNIGNPIYVDANGVGTRGMFVIKSGIDQYMAFEASCPNHAPNNCSTMKIEGQTAICDCEGYEYSLFTGQLLNRPKDGKRYYDMLYYQANFNGDVVTVSN